MILLFSGGLDSYIAWWYLNNPKTLYFDIGHKYCVHEVEKVKELVPKTIIDSRLRLTDWEEKDANIPMRNVFFVMMATFYDNDIKLIVQKGEMDIPDRSETFLNNFGHWLSFFNEREIKIGSPFTEMTKTDIVAWYLKDGLPAERLIRTRSCFSPFDLPCGACSACFRRWVAFTNNDLSEEYKNNILDYDKIPEYIRKMKNDEYDVQRTSETFDALERVGYKI